MKLYAQQPRQESRTIQGKAGVKQHSSISRILQAYRNYSLGGTVQRESAEEEDELMQGKFDTTQREEMDVDETVQGKFKASEAGQVVAQRAENNTGLPDNLKAGVETLSGYSMNDVRVYFNSDKPTQLNALAFAQGTEIHVAPGQEKHLPYEAWHVAQQKQGRVKPTMQLCGVNVNDSGSLEEEADMMGGRAATLFRFEGASGGQRKVDMSSTVFRNGGGVAQKVVQREPGGPGERESSVREITDLISNLQKMSGELPAEESDKAGGQLAACIASLEDIKASGDEVLMAEFVCELRKELARFNVFSFGGKDDAPLAQVDTGVLQGFWPLDGLWMAVKGLSGTTKAVGGVAIAVVLVVAKSIVDYKIKCEKCKKTLSASVRATYDGDAMVYLTLLLRHAEMFCCREGFAAGERDYFKFLCESEFLNARGNEAAENAFWSHYLIPVLMSAFSFSSIKYLRDEFVNPFCSGITTVGGKKRTIPIVKKEDKTGFVKALQKMKFVENLYNKTVFERMKSKGRYQQSNLRGMWKDGGNLEDNIREVPAAAPLTNVRDEIDNSNFKNKVKSTDLFYKQALQEDVMNGIRKPVMYVHLQNQSTFRAYYFNEQCGVHVAQDQSQEVIAHEVGHHIEYHIPVAEYADIRILLESRNKGQKAAYIYRDSWEEQRYTGDYPVTGPYTSKYYDEATEVMSMRQYLADPNNFKRLIEGDPQQAAIILRILHPNEYRGVGELRVYDQYLP